MKLLVGLTLTQLSHYSEPLISVLHTSLLRLSPLLFNSSLHSNSVHVSSSAASDSLLLGISLICVPSLMAVVMTQSILHQLEQLGVVSEEVFRGDRLPVLPFPDRS